MDTTPGGKLHVLATPGSEAATALLVNQQGTTGTTYGLDVTNNEPSLGFNPGIAYGIRSRVKNAAIAYGVHSSVSNTSGQSGTNRMWGVYTYSHAFSPAIGAGGVYGGVAAAANASVNEILGGQFRIEMGPGNAHGTVRGVDAKIVPSSSTATTVHGGYFEAAKGTTGTYGVQALALGAGVGQSCGVLASGNQAGSFNYGVMASSSSIVQGSTNYAVHARVSGGTGTRYGLYAQAPVDANSYAGYFNGDVHVTGTGYHPGGVWTPSDAELKTGVEDLQGASATLAQLTPKTYHYLAQEHLSAALPEGMQAGLMAQDLQDVLPQLVREISIPALLDTLGVELAPAETIMAINYTGLVPYLIAAFNEQQKRLDQLEESLAACCAQDTDKSYQPGPMDGYGQVKQDPALERWLRIDPNPFTDATTVRYTLEHAGRVQLLVNSGDGKQLQVLHESLASAGDHRYDWHTAHLTPGVYYVTLLLDGEPLVKRAVKVR
ncbi:MAG: tail fiber domain-containing protein [Flavobacteriales bacterium]|nr:tail fiber domain-containing protein [Flavobacteriales bacterium]